jgi:glycosyltransferase involved in cell wall biosynthesis
VIAVSQALQQQLLAAGVPSRRLRLIPNAWKSMTRPFSRGEARYALGLDPGSRTLGWIGRLSQEKAPDVMVEALAACALNDVVLSMIGSGPMEAQLRALAREQRVAHRIRWHGAVPEASRYLSAFDAVLLTSWTEGTPIVLLEAMTAGVPVITTAVGGVPDVVSDQEALLVPPGRPTAVARAIEGLFSDQEASDRRARNAERRVIHDFAVRPWVERYRTVYASCL